MNFIADEGIDGSLVAMLRVDGHDVLYFAETDKSTEDEVILEISNRENRILITRDKDFGELVYRLKRIHTGIILVRLEELSSLSRSRLVSSFIAENLGGLVGSSSFNPMERVSGKCDGFKAVFKRKRDCTKQAGAIPFSFSGKYKPSIPLATLPIYWQNGKLESPSATKFFTRAGCPNWVQC